MTRSNKFLTPIFLNVLVCLGYFSNHLTAQERFVHKREQQRPPYAQWISSTETNGNEYAVLLFRKDFELNDIADSFQINISADNRYDLYVNGVFVHRGPAFGSLERWYYDTFDISEYLQKGKNTLAVKVWNFGQYNAQRQQSVHTAFVLQAQDPKYAGLLNTDADWKVTRDTSYNPIVLSNQEIGGGYIAYPSDSVGLKGQIPYWYRPDFNTQSWKNAISLGYGNEAGLNSWKTTEWNLTPRTIPIFPDSTDNSFQIRKTDGIKTESLHNLQIPAFSEVEILLDHKVLTMGYPLLMVSGGKEGTVQLRYQESLFHSEDGSKGNRNQIENKQMKGLYDSFSLTGADSVSYTPLSLRTFRYVQLRFKSGRQPIVLHDFYNRYSAFPFIKTGSFKANDPSLTNILDTSWRTARLCAHETYMDCPYYEQLQYIGDTRIQALISLYQTKNDELVTNAIRQFKDSFTSIGLTQSRYPSDVEQIIPPFSLLYILMLHDYYLLRDDATFIAENIQIVPLILHWFIQYLDSSYLITDIPYWNHTDGGAEGFEIGEPPFLNERPNAQLALLLAHSIDAFLEMSETTSLNVKTVYFKELSKNIKQQVYQLCFDTDRGLVAESPQKEVFTEHTNALAVLADVPGINAEAVVTSMHTDTLIIRATTYHKFYTFKAFAKAGKGHLILDMLAPWQKALSLGLTTFPEHGTESRSDCHAWSAHLLYDLPALVAGIQPQEKGFLKVSIRPQDQSLSKYSTTVQHPNGTLKMVKQNPTTYEIVLPEKLFGTFQLGEKHIDLKPGTNQIKLK